MSETPQRTPQTPRTPRSRPRTPRSRSRTPHRTPRDTPNRTPSRRRSALLTAAVLLNTPRRSRKRSTTPQNTLRVLSRALAKESMLTKALVKESQEERDAHPQSEEEKEEGEEEELGEMGNHEQLDHNDEEALRQEQSLAQYHIEEERSKVRPVQPALEEPTDVIALRSLQESEILAPSFYNAETNDINVQSDVIQQDENIPLPNELFHNEFYHDYDMDMGGFGDYVQDQDQDLEQEGGKSVFVTPTNDILQTPPRLTATEETPFQTPRGGEGHSPLISRRLSDIAIPQGLAPDNVFLDPKELEELEELEQPERHNGRSGTRLENKSPNVTAPLKSTKNSKMVKDYTKAILKKPLNENAFPLLLEAGERFIGQLSEDLAAYAEHSEKDEIIDIRTMYTLFRRQRFAISVETMMGFVEKELPFEHISEVRRNINKI